MDEALGRGNAVVFFDVRIGGSPEGRIRFEVFNDVVPKTAENFRQLCTGECRRDGLPIGYKGCKFHRLIKGFMVQGGDFVNGDGTGSRCIYGTKFEDENFALKHDTGGLLSMANSGKDTNGCQFFLTFGPAKWLDGKHVVFGKVLGEEEDMVVLKKIENVSTIGGDKPSLDIEIEQCGEL
uniref:Peptidyl-prolyl cis-trans isomerase n=1 Tax=Mucochytrium quahogii TaxID=96639 RepID=A0A7S2SDT5_9STRA|mmetsp:Transcript_15325/g.24960  ORF Transcript_15325/g.24960 Transcript_15325/m.24960 type:complete len:180 (+) Transcript_15325:14-553(+)